MRCELKTISNYMYKKASSYLRIVIGIFICTLICLSSVMVFYKNQKIREDKNYNKNSKIHTIRVVSKTNKEYELEQLTVKDSKNIETILERDGVNANQYTISNIFAITFGITDNNNEGYVIYGIGNENKELVGELQLQNDVLYMEQPSNQQVDLDIPVLNMKEGGISVSKSVLMPVTCEAINLSKSPLMLYKTPHKNLNYAYVNEKTFLKMIGIMNKIDEVESLHSDKLEQISFVDELYVYVKQVGDIDRIASLLEKNYYQLVYSLSAFDSFSEDYKNASIFVTMFVVLFVLIASIHVILSFKSYIKLQQKDMGILKHLGYSIRDISIIYRRNINHMFMKLTIGIVLYTCFIGSICLGITEIGSILLIMLIVASILILINAVINCAILKKFIKKDILTLVRSSKEFE